MIDLLALLPGPAEAAAFMMAVFVLNATPGVDFLLTIGRTLQGGWRAGMAAALGICAGCVVHALAAAFGLAALLALHPRTFVAIQWVGAAYLVWLGLGMLRSAWHSGDEGEHLQAAPTSRSAWADFRAGILTNVLNPKMALFFLAFLPQFVPGVSPNPTVSFLLLGGWFIAQSVVFLMVLVALAAKLQRLGGNSALKRALNATGGLLFIALALRILLEEPRSA